MLPLTSGDKSPMKRLAWLVVSSRTPKGGTPAGLPVMMVAGDAEPLTEGIDAVLAFMALLDWTELFMIGVPPFLLVLSVTETNVELSEGLP